MKNLTALLLYCLMCFLPLFSGQTFAGTPTPPEVPVFVPSEVDYITPMDSALTRILFVTSDPIVGSVGGEWAILARARAGLELQDGTWAGAYLANLNAALADPAGEVISSKTDWERVVLAVSSLGLDASNYNGRDLTAAFKNYAASPQINGDIFALIALSSKNYPGDAAQYLERILSLQKPGGDWSQTGDPEEDGSIDMTAMALQALTPYQSQADVNAAIDKALTWLSSQQSEDGNLKFDGAASSESIVQVVTALSALGLDAATDPRFVKNGISLLDALLAFYLPEDLGFKHDVEGGVNAMATEQAAYALVAYNRFKTGRPSLYSMTDAGTETTPGVVMTDVEAVHVAANALTWYTIRNANTDSNDVTTNLNLPTYGVNDVLITWSVSGGYITAAGAVTRPSHEESNKTVTLTASLTKGGAAETVSFTVVVRSLSQGAMKVMFRLAGDSKHETPGRHESYVDWIPMTEFTFDGVEAVTVEEVFFKALSRFGLGASVRGTGDKYVESVTYNGLTLGEFDNGRNSGWMYIVNGTHPGLGMSNWTVKDGDIVVWHYIDDYIKEEQEWNMAFPYGFPNGLGGVTDTAETEDYQIEAVEKVEAAVRNGTVSVVIDSAKVSAMLERVKSGIAKAKDRGETGVYGGLTFTITDQSGTGTSGTDQSGSVSVGLYGSAIRTIAQEDNISLTIESGLGYVTLDGETLDGLANEAVDNDLVQIIITDVSGTKQPALNSAQQKAAGESRVFELKIMISSRLIQDFKGMVAVFLAYRPDGDASPSSYTVCLLAEDGTKTTMKNVRYDPDKTGYVFTTEHFSLFLVALPETTPLTSPAADETPLAKPAAKTAAGWVNPYKDVAADAWYYPAVQFVTENSLISGMSGGLFEPARQMSRAMLVTVLYRYAGSPSVTSRNPFADVKDGEWYADAVIWGKESGLAAGYESGLFGTSDPVTREQTAAILYNYAVNNGLKTGGGYDLSSYADKDQISSYAHEAMQWARGEEIILGRDRSALAPLEKSTRAEVARILSGFIQKTQ